MGLPRPGTFDPGSPAGVFFLHPCSHVTAFFNGHNHAGNYGIIGGQHFLNFKGMVETPDHTAYSTVNVFDDRIEVTGHVLEEDGNLSIAEQAYAVTCRAAS